MAASPLSCVDPEEADVWVFISNSVSRLSSGLDIVSVILFNPSHFSLVCLFLCFLFLSYFWTISSWMMIPSLPSFGYSLTDEVLLGSFWASDVQKDQTQCPDQVAGPESSFLVPLKTNAPTSCSLYRKLEEVRQQKVSLLWTSPGADENEREPSLETLSEAGQGK